MPTELEKDINEIKISVAVILERLKVFDLHMMNAAKHEDRIRILEEYKAKMIGMAMAVGGFAGTVASIIIKLA